MDPRAAGTVRDIARNAVRSHVVDVALDLFVAHGFEETTVDAVCAAAGISRSTFFRHFRNKDELMLGHIERFGERIAASLAQQPPSVPLWPAMRRAFDELIDAYAASPGAVPLARLVAESPQLRSGEARKSAQWLALLGPEIARRTGCGTAPDDPTPAAVVGAMIAAVDAALAAWAATDGRSSLAALLDQAMAPFGLPAQ